MRANLAGVSLLACVLGLSACADRDTGGRADAGTCSPFTTAAATPTGPAGVAPAATGGEQAAFDDCLHRWGYRLARADEDSAETVGAAVVAACAPALVAWNSSTLAQAQTGPDEAVSLVSGETSTTLADRYASAQSKAVFYVVQARAGNCAVPPADAATK
jgi:hypothetical protein